MNVSMTDTHQTEIENGARFKFGANWSRFLATVSEERIDRATRSLCEYLEVDTLSGKRFLDAGSGSGLFSVAARRLGAEVHSFDYDPQSVACTRELKRRYYPGDKLWVVEEASVLDCEYLAALGKFDVVYSWGVLHHTGSMWSALDNICSVVAEGGQLFVAIYNDQGWISRYWALVKRCYVAIPILRPLLLLLHLPYLFGLRIVVRKLSGKSKLERGMSLWYDAIDWIGGYPFEVARPEEIFDLYRAKRFSLSRLRTCGGRHGCNEFVFRAGEI